MLTRGEVSVGVVVVGFYQICYWMSTNIGMIIIQIIFGLLSYSMWIKEVEHQIFKWKPTTVMHQILL
jgi:hypothetical protein